MGDENWTAELAATLTAAFAGRDEAARAAASERLVKLAGRTKTIKNATGLDPLIAAIDINQVDARLAIGELLTKVRDRRALPFLVALLAHEDFNYCLGAQKALKSLGWKPPTIEQEVLLYIHEADRTGAARKLGQRAVPALIALLAHDPKVAARANAADALGRIGDWRAVDGLIAAMDDKESWVRYTAALALGEIGDQRAIPALRGKLLDPTCDIRGQAATALAKFGRAAVPALCEALSARPLEGGWQIAWYLGNIGDTAAGDTLAAVVDKSDHLLRKEAGLALGKLCDPRGLAALRYVADDGWDASEAVGLIIATLRESADRASIDELRALASIPDAWQTITGEAVGFGSEPILDPSRVDCEEVRNLARQELRRRGLAASAPPQSA